MQLTSLSYKKVGDANPFFSLTYGYGSAGSNNGQIMSITDNVESGAHGELHPFDSSCKAGLAQGRLYDALHRLKTAVTTGKGGVPSTALKVK